MYKDKERGAASLKVDPGQSPAHYDITYEDGPAKGTTLKGDLQVRGGHVDHVRRRHRQGPPDGVREQARFGGDAVCFEAGQVGGRTLLWPLKSTVRTANGGRFSSFQAL